LSIFIIVYTILDIEWTGNVGLQAEITDMNKDMVFMSTDIEISMKLMSLIVLQINRCQFEDMFS
jgi:hypothetical protein